MASKHASVAYAALTQEEILLRNGSRRGRESNPRWSASTRRRAAIARGKVKPIQVVYARLYCGRVLTYA